MIAKQVSSLCPPNIVNCYNTESELYILKVPIPQSEFGSYGIENFEFNQEFIMNIFLIHQ